jgi:predicted PurR-regulated permease PerM
MAANPVNLNQDPELQSPDTGTQQPPIPDIIRIKSSALTLISVTAVFAAMFVAKIVFIVLFLSLLLAFVLEPVTRLFERLRLPRSVAAFISVALFVVALWGVAKVSYNKAVSFAQDLPRYSGEIRSAVGKFRRQAQTIQKSTQQVLPEEASDKNTMKVRQQSSWTDTLFSSVGTASEIFFAASFIPFLAYFMLTWKEHTRSNTVLMFSRENRNTAYAALGAITDMIRAFIVGNVLVGLFIGAISTVIFGFMGLPYFYFIGFISGFLSLVPYLGVLLAAVPPLITGLGHLHSSGLAIIIATVVGLHLFALNVLYPKFLGRRLQLNPLAVTVALLFWGWIWGAMGLVLAIPVTAAVKIVCDHIENLSALGSWLGE